MLVQGQGTANSMLQAAWTRQLRIPKELLLAGGKRSSVISTARR